MTGEPTRTSAHSSTFKAVPFFHLGAGVSEAFLSTQRALLEGYEETTRAWLERAQAEASLWSELPAKMAESGSVANALELYSDCVSRQMQLSLEDGQQLLDDCRRVAQKVVNSLGGKQSTAQGSPELPLRL